MRVSAPKAGSHEFALCGFEDVLAMTASTGTTEPGSGFYSLVHAQINRAPVGGLCQSLKIQEVLPYRFYALFSIYALSASRACFVRVLVRSKKSSVCLVCV